MNKKVKKTESTEVALTEADLISTLQTSLYAGASEDSIKMVINYCREAKLDPLLKPVHIVPMWDKKTEKLKDLIMPGIGHYRTQAERSKYYAGITEPEYGEEKKSESGVKFPLWCKITVKRLLPNGSIGEFTAKEFWLENYAIKGGKEKDQSPNAMWTKRPYGQLAKCTEAQALRKAFPELLGAQPTAEEMAGKEIDITDESTEINVEQPVAKSETKKEKSIEDAEIIEEKPLTIKQIEEKIVACESIDELKVYYDIVNKMEKGDDKDHLIIVGKTKDKELKKASKK